MFFKRNDSKHKTYDSQKVKPVIRASICTGERACGFKDLVTGRFEEVMLVTKDSDIETFKKMYSIDGEIEKDY